MPRGSKSVNRPPTPEPEDQQRELTLEEDIRLKVTHSTAGLFCLYGLPLLLLLQLIQSGTEQRWVVPFHAIPSDPFLIELGHSL